MKKPNFFIIGAPKCGTSSLYHWLSRHPKVFTTDIKEPHFFAEELKSRRVRTLNRYEELFKNATNNHLAIGEASTGYLFYQEAVTRIENRYSDVKYVVMLRNPTEMAKSLHEQEIQCGTEHVRDFESAWRLSPERRRGRRVHFGCEDPKRLDYMNRCSLGSQLERLLDTVPKRRVLIIFLEDIKENSKKEYERCLRFLGVPTDGRLKFPVKNESKGVKYPKLRRFIRAAGKLRDSAKRMVGMDNSLGVGLMEIVNNKGSGNRKNENIKDSFEIEINEYFEKEIEKISSITGINSNHWN